MRAKKSVKDLVKGQDYEVQGTWKDLDGTVYYQVVIGERVVLYRPCNFEKEVVVDDDEF